MIKETDHGFVYLVTNGDFEKLGTYKIGKTVSVEQRLSNFNSSTESIPDWRAIAYIESDNMSALENMMHFIFRDQRRSPKREFFDFAEDREDGFSLDEAITMFEKQAKLIGGEFTLMEDVSAVKTETNQPKNKFQLSMLGAKAGDEIVWRSSDGTKTKTFYIAAHKGHFGRMYLVEDASMIDTDDPSIYQSWCNMGMKINKEFDNMGSHDGRYEPTDKRNWFYNGKAFQDYYNEYLQTI